MSNGRQFKIEGKELNQHFSNCQLSSFNPDGRLMAINDKYLAMAWEGKDKKGNIKLINKNLKNDNYYFTSEHANILDMEFSPFDNNILSSCYDNNCICLTKLDLKDENNIITIPYFYKAHNNKVNSINFNPIAEHIICSTTVFGQVNIWESNEFKTYYSFKLKKNPNYLSWSPNGDLIGISCLKGRYFNLLDPRSKEKPSEILLSDTNINSRFAWVDNDIIATVRWSKDAKIVLSLCDLRKNDKSIKDNNFLANIPLSDNISKNASSINPYVNPEMKLIYIIGKGIKNITVFDYEYSELKKKYEFNCSEVNNFSLIFNRHYLDKENSEIDRFIRYTQNKNIYYVSFNFSKGEKFDGILYPNKELSKPQMTHKEWNAGKKFEKLIDKNNQENPNLIQYKNNKNNKNNEAQNQNQKQNNNKNNAINNNADIPQQKNSSDKQQKKKLVEINKNSSKKLEKENKSLEEKKYGEEANKIKP